MCNISTSKHARYKLKVSDKNKRCLIKDEEAEMILQNRKIGSGVITYPGSSQKQGLFFEFKMASAGATIWLPDTERFLMALSTIITRAQQQRNATATEFDSSELIVL